MAVEFPIETMNQIFHQIYRRMKMYKLPGVMLLMLLAFSTHAQDEAAQDSTGLPGDNFSLAGALELFKKASSPEEFEKMLNDKENKVNNLDLNEDGEVDYIRVVDNMDKEAHALVLQVPVSETESQDIAVIEVEKTGAEEASLQIVGNEDIYGQEQIVEPSDEKADHDNGHGKNGPAMSGAPVRIVVNVWVWPCVRFVYAPAYSVWVSPWHWRAYPTYWRPWRPYPFVVYRGWAHPWRRHYAVVTTHRLVRAHAVYAPHRVYSPRVRTHTTTVVARRGPHGTTVTKRTTNAGPRGRKTTTTTVHQGRNGKVTGAKKTTNVRRRH